MLPVQPRPAISHNIFHILSSENMKFIFHWQESKHSDQLKLLIGSKPFSVDKTLCLHFSNDSFYRRGESSIANKPLRFLCPRLSRSWGDTEQFDQRWCHHSAVCHTHCCHQPAVVLRSSHAPQLFHTHQSHNILSVNYCHHQLCTFHDEKQGQSCTRRVLWKWYRGKETNCVCSWKHSCLKGSKPKKNSPVLRLVPFFVKLPHESPQKNWKSGHEGFLRNLHFCFFPL